MCYREQRLEDSYSFKVISILLPRLYISTLLSIVNICLLVSDTVKCSGRGILRCFINAALKRQVPACRFFLFIFLMTCIKFLQCLVFVQIF